MIALPGHSSGSIGLLTADGDFFSGDLLANSRRGPRMGPIVDDRPAMEASVALAKSVVTGTVYPGHGEPFAIGHLE